jgi:hypothetical protein
VDSRFGATRFDQAWPGQHKHDAQRYDVHAWPFTDEEEDGDETRMISVHTHTPLREQI